MKSKKKNNKFVLLGGKVLVSLVLVLVTYNVNTCCALFAFQDEIPEEAYRFKKF